MSVIALQDSYIVTDGRYSGDGNIIEDDFLKMVEAEGKAFFYVGTPAKIDLFIKHYCSGEFVPENQKQINVEAIVFDGDKIINAWVESTKGDIVKVPINPSKGFAIGSGSPHARTALDMGCTAFEAVKAGIKRDYYCGGVIRVWDFKLYKGNFIFQEPVIHRPIYESE